MNATEQSWQRQKHGKDFRNKPKRRDLPGKRWRLPFAKRERKSLPLIILFWDASVIGSATRTQRRATESAPLAIMYLSALGMVISVTSELAVEETVRSIKRTTPLPQRRSLLRILKRILGFFETIVPAPSPARVRQCAKVEDPKDAHILAAARMAQCHFLLTYNTLTTQSTSAASAALLL